MPLSDSNLRRPVLRALILVGCLVLALTFLAPALTPWFGGEARVPYLDGACRLWSGWLKAVWVVGELWVALSYYRIPWRLYQTRKRLSGAVEWPDVRLYGLFILACGVGHTVGALMPLFGLYELLGLWTLVVTGTVSEAAAQQTSRWAQRVERSTPARRDAAATALGELLAFSDQELEALERGLLEESRQTRSLRAMMRTLGDNQEDRLLSRVKLDAEGKPVFVSTDGEGWVVDRGQIKGQRLASVFPGDWPHLEPYYTRAFAGERVTFIYRLVSGGALYWTRLHPLETDTILIDCLALPDTWQVPEGEVGP